MDDELTGAARDKKFYLVVGTNDDRSLDIYSDGPYPWNSEEDASIHARVQTDEHGGEMVLVECVAIKSFVRGKVRMTDIRPKGKK